MLFFAALLLPVATGFTPAAWSGALLSRRHERRLAFSARSDELATMGLTPRLEEIVNGLRSLPDDKMRVKQVLYLATQGSEMAPALKTR